MNYQGIIKKWDKAKGFGFIQETRSSTEIFAHISAFHIKKPPPEVGEEVTFTIGSNQKGGKTAQNIRRYRNGIELTEIPVQPRKLHHSASRRLSPNRFFLKIVNALITVILLIMIMAAGILIYEKFYKNKITKSAVDNVLLRQPLSSEQPFRCDGRRYCSQMRSCAEAKYFLTHCPNTEMDGDNDGIPCERQWCK